MIRRTFLQALQFLALIVTLALCGCASNGIKVANLTDGTEAYELTHDCNVDMAACEQEAIYECGSKFILRPPTQTKNHTGRWLFQCPNNELPKSIAENIKQPCVCDL